MLVCMYVYDELIKYTVRQSQQVVALKYSFIVQGVSSSGGSSGSGSGGSSSSDSGSSGGGSSGEILLEFVREGK